jgi:hypothetical protein
MPDLSRSSGGMPFDYNAPAELFLSKPAKGGRTKYRRFATAAEALRYAIEDLSGMSASTAAKFNACTKPRTILCGSQSDAERMAPSLLNDLRCARLSECPRIDSTTPKATSGIDWCET